MLQLTDNQIWQFWAKVPLRHLLVNFIMRFLAHPVSQNKSVEQKYLIRNYRLMRELFWLIRVNSGRY